MTDNLMRTFAFILFINIILISCADAKNTIHPSIYISEFQGFTFNAEKQISNRISGYEYQTIDSENIKIQTCDQASHFDISKIAEFEYFRFKLLQLSCKAAEVYSTARDAKTSYFPEAFTQHFFETLPASTVPLLSKADASQRKDKTLLEYNKHAKFQTENSHTVKLLTKDDEIYITILARGDFNNDGFEDLLVKSEWYARNAFGKHTDLLILTKTDKDQPIKIDWRLNPITSQ